MICAWIETSSAETGSSARSASARGASARAIPIRWRCPPRELVREAVLVLGVEPDALQQLAHAALELDAARRRAAPAARRRSGRPACAGSATRTGPGRPSASRAAPAAARAAQAVVMSRPPKRSSRGSGPRAAAAPGSASTCPQPDSPTSPSVSPSLDVNETSSTACTRPTVAAISSPDRREVLDEVRDLEQRRRRSTLDVTVVGPRAEADRRPRPRAASRFCSGDEPAAIGVRRSPAAGLERRHLGALSNACGQRGRKWQPCGGASSDGGDPGIGGSRCERGAVEPRDRAQQPPGVGMPRVVEDLVQRALLDDAARVHHQHAVGDLGDHAEVVGDQDDRQSRAPPAAARAARRICAWIVTSSAVVGSSAISSSGAQESAIAIITRWRIPPRELVRDSARRARPGRGCRPRSSSSTARSRAAPWRRPSCARICSTIWSPTR